MIKITDGSTVHTISRTVPWTTFLPVSALTDSALKKYSVRTKTTRTKNKINVIKNIKSWCRFIIPSITGVAASWKPNCQGDEESNKTNESIKKIRKNVVQNRFTGLEPAIYHLEGERFIQFKLKTKDLDNI